LPLQCPRSRTNTRYGNEAAYVALFNAIQEYGRTERYKGRPNKYLYPGDGWKYWAMTNELGQSRVINRMKIEDDLERLCREGQIAPAIERKG
jgi:hypothetical protein